MTHSRRSWRHAQRQFTGAFLALAMLAFPTVDIDAAAAVPGLDLGAADLLEVRTVQALAPGVRLTRIVRGTVPAPVSQIATTRRGPWRVNVLSIDPRSARGHLRASYGPNLAAAETTTALVRAAGALAGVNASFFTFAKDRRYSGEPVGLGLYAGAVLSEPAAKSTEVDLVIDATRNKVMVGHLTWSGKMKNRRTGRTMRLEFLNHPPVVPARCAKKTQQTRCRKSGDVVHFTGQFSRSTPAGYGVEVILDARGCVVKSVRRRGAILARGQTSLQATGRQTRRLLRLTRRGCLTRSLSIRNEDGSRLTLHRGLFGVAGRYRLTRGGRIVAPNSTGDFFRRHPRTLAGTTADGRILLITIDGRQPISVGATLTEAAAVARSLGLRDSVNLDGGGSTTMSVAGLLANRPSGAAGERAVGDALVYVDVPA